jgi:hypothetical protein
MWDAPVSIVIGELISGPVHVCRLHGELVIGTERSEEGQNLRPQCQSCVESGKPRADYGKRVFNVEPGCNVCRRNSGGHGNERGRDEDDETYNNENNEQYDNDGDWKLH